MLAQLRVARSLGISYKRWLGWEPTPDDPIEWDSVERDWMMALDAYEHGHKCPVCGMDIGFCHDEMAVATAFRNAGVETCHVGRMRELAMAQFAESGTVDAPNSQTTKLNPR